MVLQTVRVGSCSSNGLPGYLPSPLPWNKTKDKELLGSTLTSPRLLANASQIGVNLSQTMATDEANKCMYEMCITMHVRQTLLEFNTSNLQVF